MYYYLLQVLIVVPFYQQPENEKVYSIVEYHYSYTSTYCTTSSNVGSNQTLTYYTYIRIMSNLD